MNGAWFIPATGTVNPPPGDNNSNMVNYDPSLPNNASKLVTVRIVRYGGGNQQGRIIKSVRRAIDKDPPVTVEDWLYQTLLDDTTGRELVAAYVPGGDENGRGILLKLSLGPKRSMCSRVNGAPVRHVGPLIIELVAPDGVVLSPQSPMYSMVEDKDTLSVQRKEHPDTWGNHGLAIADENEGSYKHENEENENSSDAAGACNVGGDDNEDEDDISSSSGAPPKIKNTPEKQQQEDYGTGSGTGYENDGDDPSDAGSTTGPFRSQSEGGGKEKKSLKTNQKCPRSDGNLNDDDGRDGDSEASRGANKKREKDSGGDDVGLGGAAGAGEEAGEIAAPRQLFGVEGKKKKAPPKGGDNRDGAEKKIEDVGGDIGPVQSEKGKKRSGNPKEKTPAKRAAKTASKGGGASETTQYSPPTVNGQTLGERDVLMGQGRDQKLHAGNARYDELIGSSFREWNETASDSEKRKAFCDRVKAAFSFYRKVGDGWTIVEGETVSSKIKRDCKKLACPKKEKKEKKEDGNDDNGGSNQNKSGGGVGLKELSRPESAIEQDSDKKKKATSSKSKKGKKRRKERSRKGEREGINDVKDDGNDNHRNVSDDKEEDHNDDDDSSVKTTLKEGGASKSTASSPQAAAAAK